MADRVIDRQELAHQLRLPPRAVRRLVENYREWLSAPGSGRFTALDVARLQIAARMSLAGRPRSAILDALATTRPQEDPKTSPAIVLDEHPAGTHQRTAGGRPRRQSQPASQDAGAQEAQGTLQAVPLAASEQVARHGEAEVAAAGQPLAEEIGKLREVIVQHAERDRLDRDRVLMALVRTQQEVSHLRSEIGTLKSRKDRRRGSVIRRLFG